jgi:TetR/AcrR family transcriptional repressor of nem operon
MGAKTMRASAMPEQILDAAERRFRARGYHAVSFRELAGDVALKSASVHYHYPSKAHLVAAMVERYHRRFCETLEARAGSAGPQARLKTFVAIYREVLEKDGAICVCGLLGAESRGLPEAVTRAVRDFFEANIAWVSAALAEGAMSEAPLQDAITMVSALQGAMMLAVSLGDHTVLDAVAERVLRPFAG